MILSLAKHVLTCASRNLHTTASIGVNVVFIEKGQQVSVKAIRGDTLMETAKDNQLNLPGSCGGMCECSTCHVIPDQETFDKLPPAEEEELDTLDSALGVTDLSRLACQIDITKDIEGGVFTIPDSFEDAR